MPAVEHHPTGIGEGPPSRFVVVIPAKDESELLAPTVVAVKQLAEVDEVVVVDDGSTDGTAEVAAASGARVMHHGRSRGKGRALATGADAVWQRARTEAGVPPGLVFLDADVGSTAADLGALLRPVLDDELDLAIALYQARGDEAAHGGHGFVVGLARRAIMSRTGWRPKLPLSGVRALAMPAYEAVRPLAAGWGVERAMTLDALSAGLRVGEVGTTLTHRPTGNDWRAQIHRARQYGDVVRALATRPARP